MGGRTFVEGEQKARPGSYIRYYNAGGATYPVGEIGITAAILKTTWGPVGEIIEINDPNNMDSQIGENEAADQIFQGGANTLYVVRAGTSGAKATATISGITLNTLYPTSRSFNVTVRESLEEGMKEFILFEDQRRIERLTFESGSSEVSALTDIINNESEYLTANKGDTAEGSVETVSNEKMTDGSDPDVTTSDYTEVMEKLDTKDFSGIITDSLEMEVHTALDEYVNRRFEEGTQMIGVVGQDTSVEFSERRDNAKSFDDFQMVFVGNGFLTNTNEELEGVPVIARVMALAVSDTHTNSLTHQVIENTTGIVGELSNTQYNEAAENGMLVFSESEEGAAQIDYGINTKVTFGEDEDQGWNKIRRARTRFELFTRATNITDRLTGDRDNDGDGRAHIISVLNEMIQNMPGISQGEFIIDPDNPPEGDSVWLSVVNLVDTDSIEKFYMKFGFQY